MKKTWYFSIVLSLVMAILLTACGSGGSNASPTATTASGANQAPTTAGAAPTSAATTQGAGSATTAATSAATTAATTASGSVPQTGGGCPLQVEQGATITFSGWGDQTEQKIYRDSIDRFKAVCPGVTVNYNPIPTDFQTKLKAEMAGGTAPDVFYVDDQLMSAFAPSGQLLALDDLMKQAGVKNSDFIPQLMTLFTYQGKVYGLPKDWGTLGLIYLPDAFKQAGIPEPTDQWTWTDMVNAAKTIATKTKMAGFCQAPDYARFAPFVFSNGGNFTSPDYKTPTLNTPQVTDMANLIAGMVKDKSLIKPSDVGASWCGEALGKQLVAMTLEGGWMVNFMNQTYPKVTYKAAEIPKGRKTRADVIFTNAIGVNASTKFPKAAAALAIYITGRANQADIVKTGFAYSTHPDQANLITNPIDQAVSKGGLLPDSKVAYWGLNTGKLEDAISKALERVYLNQQSVSDSFSQLQQESQSILNGQ